MSRASDFLLSLCEEVEDFEGQLNKQLSSMGYEGLSAVVSDIDGHKAITFSDGEEESSVIFASLDGVSTALVLGDEEDDDLEVELEGSSGYGAMLADKAFLNTVLGLAGMIEIEVEEDDDDEDEGSPDAHGYTNEGVGVGPKKAKFVIRGGKKKKIFVRKKKMKMKGSERMARKRGAKKAARARRAKKAIMARKRAKSLKIRGRMHLKSLKGWRKK